jgi:hypothetical protein
MTNVAPPPDDGAPDPTRFAVVPVSVLEDTRLSDAATRLYAVLDGRITAKGSQRVRQDTLAGQLGWSRSKVQRITGELARAGYIEIRRTSRSSRIVLSNPVRTGKPDTMQPDSDAANLTPQDARSVKSDAADASNLTPRQINKSLRIKNNNNAAAEPSRSSAPASASAAEKIQDYLDAIHRATGCKVDATKTTQRNIAAIRSQGLTAADMAALVVAYLAVAGDGVHSPAGFIAGHVLPDLAAGNKPSQVASDAPTPTPTAFAELQNATPCEHGEPRGPDACALCRNGELDQAAADGKRLLARSELFRALQGVIGGRATAGNNDGEPWGNLVREHPDDPEIVIAASLSGLRLDHVWLQLIVPPHAVDLVRYWVDRSEMSPRPSFAVSAYGDCAEIQITYQPEQYGWSREIERMDNLVKTWQRAPEVALRIDECNQRLERSKTAQRIQADLSPWSLKPVSWLDFENKPWGGFHIANPKPDRWLLTDEDAQKALPEHAQIWVLLLGDDLHEIEQVQMDADDLHDASIRAALQSWLTDNGIKGRWERESSEYTVSDTASLRCTFAPGQTAEILTHLPALVDLWAIHCTKVYGDTVAA